MLEWHSASSSYAYGLGELARHQVVLQLMPLSRDACDESYSAAPFSSSRAGVYLQRICCGAAAVGAGYAGDGGYACVREPFQQHPKAFAEATDGQQQFAIQRLCVSRHGARMSQLRHVLDAFGTSATLLFHPFRK
jgi:hypothetical protein